MLTFLIGVVVGSVMTLVVYAGVSVCKEDWDNNHNRKGAANDSELDR